jgi:uncharacterized protein YhaN
VERDTAQERYEQAVQDHGALCAQSAELAKTLGLAPDTNPAAFTDRHASLLQAAQMAAHLANAVAEFEVWTEQRATVDTNLAVAAKQVGIKAADSDLPILVQAQLTLQASVREAWDRWSRVKTAIVELEEKAAQAEENKVSSGNTLAALTATLTLAGSTAIDVITALPKLRTLQGLHNRHEELVSRIKALEDAVAQLRSSAERIVALGAAVADSNADPMAIIERARVLVLRAQAAMERRVDVQRRLTTETTARKIAANAVDLAQKELSDWFDRQGGEDLAASTRVDVLANRDELRAKVKAHIIARNAGRDGVKPDLFKQESDVLPNASRGAEIKQLLADAQVARDKVFQAHNEAKRLYQEAFGAADRSELLTEQATILEELRNGVRQAAVLRIGALAAKGALRRLASERRTTMLTDVEKAFVAITAPAYSGVDVWSQSDGEKLVGLEPDGTQVPVKRCPRERWGSCTLPFGLQVIEVLPASLGRFQWFWTTLWKPLMTSARKLRYSCALTSGTVAKPSYLPITPIWSISRARPLPVSISSKCRSSSAC